MSNDRIISSYLFGVVTYYIEGIEATKCQDELFLCLTWCKNEAPSSPLKENGGNFLTTSLYFKEGMTSLPNGPLLQFLVIHSIPTLISPH